MEDINYARIEKAIGFLREHFREQPSLEEVAAVVNLSPFHFQKMFTEWAGVSPKKFLQFLSVDHAKNLLNARATVFGAAVETGLTGTGRLHDLFVNIEGMTPGEYRNGGAALTIQYSMADTPFGRALVASTAKGVCHLAFTSSDDTSMAELRSQFPQAVFREGRDMHQDAALSFFNVQQDHRGAIHLHLKSTPFQIKVWQALLAIPPGALTTYAQLARSIGHEKAWRAVGSSVGDNPIAFLIPCHRVIRSSGEFGQYRWGGTRKSAIIGWELSKFR